EVHIGKALATLTGSYAPHGESVGLKGHLSGDQMAVQELESMLPALNIVLPAGATLQGGTAMAKMDISGPLDSLLSVGSLGLNNVKLANFDLGRKMAVIQALAGIKSKPTTEIQVLSGNLKHTDEGTTFDELKLIVPDIGELTGSGTINASKALDFHMRVLVKAAAIPVAVNARMQSGIPFFVRGTAQDPKFEPDLKGLATDQLNDLKSNPAKAATSIL